MNKVNIMCVFWTTEGKPFRGRDYTIKDVLRLYQSVNKHIDRPFDFYCLTNYEGKMPEPFHINRIPLIHNWQGWWSKMELGRPDLPEGRTLYMDIDSHVINSLQPILDFEGDLVVFNTQIPPWKFEAFRKKGWVCRYQNATILYDGGTEKMQYMYERFKVHPNSVIKRYRSDQDVYGDWYPNLITFPNNWMMKLKECLKLKQLPKDCIIVTGTTRDNLFRNTNRIPWFEKTARL